MTATSFDCMHAMVLNFLAVMLRQVIEYMKSSGCGSQDGVVVMTAKVGTEPGMVRTCFRTNEFDWGCLGELSDRGDCGFCGESGGCTHTHHLSMPTPMAWLLKSKGRPRVICDPLACAVALRHDSTQTSKDQEAGTEMWVKVSQSILQIRQLLTVATAANWERAWMADCRRQPCHSLPLLATSTPALSNCASLD